MKLRGTVIKAPFGGGSLLLETADGARYALAGGDDGVLTEGAEVEVEGRLADDAVGIGMTGDPVLAVERCAPA